MLQVDVVTPATNGKDLDENGRRVSPSPSLRSSYQGGVSRRASKGGHGNTPPAGDDLRNYAYEGEGSSPGSLSSCKCNVQRNGRYG